MERLLALFAGLLGVLLVPLALSGPTALLLLPSHLGLSLVVSLGAALDGLDGRPERARRWGFFYLLATLGMVAALEIGGLAHGRTWTYWGVPWGAALIWGWVPPVVSGVAGALGRTRERRLSRRAVRLRKVAGRP